MNASSESVLAVSVVAALAAAALVFGVRNAIEGLGLTILLLGLKVARAGIRGLSALLRILLR